MKCTTKKIGEEQLAIFRARLKDSGMEKQHLRLNSQHDDEREPLLRRWDRKLAGGDCLRSSLHVVAEKVGGAVGWEPWPKSRGPNGR